MTSGNWENDLRAIAEHADEAAFERLFGHFAPRIKGYLISGGMDADAADEVAQEAMANVWRKSAQFDPERAGAATWIFTIARNRRIDRLRKENRPEPDPDDPAWIPEAEPEQVAALSRQEQARALRAAVETLPEVQRMAIRNAFYGDMSHGEIAERCGLPLGTVKSRMRLALERLRAAMKDYEDPA